MKWRDLATGGQQSKWIEQQKECLRDQKQQEIVQQRTIERGEWAYPSWWTKLDRNERKQNKVQRKKVASWDRKSWNESLEKVANRELILKYFEEFSGWSSGSEDFSKIHFFAKFSLFSKTSLLECLPPCSASAHKLITAAMAGHGIPQKGYQFEDDELNQVSTSFYWC